ncbi:ATP-binding cassette domain-containing protein [Rhodococcus artemisiae]|uniref:ATP-binding cassette domain-containing protein n=1 Tax=Rhodococcus artemisiae TaxID=714159 RepID=A0ABU7L8Q7_9NOCA|nr:ATP-binding cassette domain-containing protein [Rhodococcus artemisiae]MEE2057932.1 ATP-binding cassette domain-containing protein [Rhodococcus artemisiae]
MIDVQNLTKRFGDTTAVENLSFEVGPGRVTGFLGPNGAGKTTTMRIVLGLDSPSSGAATVAGSAYRDLHDPMRTVGALLAAGHVHPGRSARDHLRMLAAVGGVGDSRVDAVLSTVGLADAASQRTGAFSLGMLQRLGIAAALLGDPPILILDEPVNGLDTDGIRWVRSLLRTFADEGRTVLLSSHVMSEMELIADHLVVIGAGRLLADEPLRDFIDRHSGHSVRVASAADVALGARLRERGAHVDVDGGGLLVRGLDARTIGGISVSAEIPLTELIPIRKTLEDVYTGLVEEHGRHRAKTEVY